jgi:hypothetical protein
LYGLALVKEQVQNAPFGNLAAEFSQVLVDDGFGESSENQLIDVLRDWINEASWSKN